MAKKQQQPTASAAKDDQPLTPAAEYVLPPPSKHQQEEEEDKFEKHDHEEDSSSETTSSSEEDDDDDDEEAPSSQPTPLFARAKSGTKRTADDNDVKKSKKNNGLSLIFSETLNFDKSLGGAIGLNLDDMKRGLELIPESKKLEFEIKWKKIQAAELEVAAMRAKLEEDQNKEILNSMKPSSSSR